MVAGAAGQGGAQANRRAGAGQAGQDALTLGKGGGGSDGPGGGKQDGRALIALTVQGLAPTQEATAAGGLEGGQIGGRDGGKGRKGKLGRQGQVQFKADLPCLYRRRPDIVPNMDQPACALAPADH